MTHLFIADLHLSPDHPRLVRGFLDLLEQYKDNNFTKPTQLYILGDWFNAWIGDDYTAPWLSEIVEHLKQFTQAGNKVYFQVGNRDFALGQKFLNQFNGQLLPDEFTLNIANKKFRIEHGDALCTDDISYQRFRKIIRNPILLGILKSTPLSFRQKLANQQAVEKALSQVDVLIHGHTHKPMIHDVNGKPRIVLGDWREKTSEAMILEVDRNANYQLIQWKIV